MFVVGVAWCSVACCLMLEVAARAQVEKARLATEGTVALARQRTAAASATNAQKRVGTAKAVWWPWGENGDSQEQGDYSHLPSWILNGHASSTLEVPGEGEVPVEAGPEVLTLCVVLSWFGCRNVCVCVCNCNCIYMFVRA